jgi:hypothetical protein
VKEKSVTHSGIVAGLHSFSAFSPSLAGRWAFCILTEDEDMPCTRKRPERRTGRIPKSILDKLKPKIIVIGEAATEHLDYYTGYNTITQNSAGDVIFECRESKIHIFTSKEYKADYLDDEEWSLNGHYYIGTLNL